MMMMIDDPIIPLSLCPAHGLRLDHVKEIQMLGGKARVLTCAECWRTWNERDRERLARDPVVVMNALAALAGYRRG
jgi:hypothetical protein